MKDYSELLITKNRGKFIFKINPFPLKSTFTMRLMLKICKIYMFLIQ